MAGMANILPALPILPNDLRHLQSGWWRLRPLHLCGWVRVWVWTALWGGVVADLCTFASSVGKSGHGGRVVLCVLVCVTLNLSLNFFASHPLPGSVSRRPVLGRVCEGGRFMVEGTLLGVSETHTLDPRETPESTSQFPEGSKPS